jgi:hypothetical protein
VSTALIDAALRAPGGTVCDEFDELLSIICGIWTCKGPGLGLEMEIGGCVSGGEVD